jgi:general secretion pathway protein C
MEFALGTTVQGARMNIARAATFLKDHNWILNAVFVFAGSYFVAGAVNAFVAKTVRILPSIDDPSIVMKAPVKKTIMRDMEFKNIADRNLLGVKRENLEPATVGEDGGGPLVYNPNDLKACTLQATLRATMVADERPEWSMAILVNPSTQEPQVYSINPGSNQIADDATLVDVRNREIVVRRRDHYEICRGEGEGAAVPNMSVPPIEEPTAQGDETPNFAVSATGVQKVSETQYNIDKNELDRVLSNLNQVATQARIVPSFKNGKANGFKLFSIRPDSIYSKIGLKNGDVIQKINGFEMNSPDKVLEVYQKLRESPQVSVELIRRGQPVTMGYNVQ